MDNLDYPKKSNRFISHCDFPPKILYIVNTELQLIDTQNAIEYSTIPDNFFPQLHLMKWTLLVQIQNKDLPFTMRMLFLQNWHSLEDGIRPTSVSKSYITFSFSGFINSKNFLNENEIREDHTCTRLIKDARFGNSKWTVYHNLIHNILMFSK